MDFQSWPLEGVFCVLPPIMANQGVGSFWWKSFLGKTPFSLRYEEESGDEESEVGLMGIGSSG